MHEKVMQGDRLESDEGITQKTIAMSAACTRW